MKYIKTDLRFFSEILRSFDHSFYHSKYSVFSYKSEYGEDITMYIMYMYMYIRVHSYMYMYMSMYVYFRYLKMSFNDVHVW